VHDSKDNFDNAVYGMVWGRSGEGPMTITLFTPMEALLKDITTRLSKSVQLAQGQTMLDPGFEEQEESPESSQGRFNPTATNTIPTASLTLAEDSREEASNPEANANFARYI